MQKIVSMTIFPFLLLALFLSGCSQSSDIASAEAHEDGPSVAVLFLGTGEQTAGAEGAHYWNLEKLPVCGGNRGMRYTGVECDGRKVAVALLWKQDDPESPGSLLLRFRVVCDTEIFDLPTVSWNQRDDLPLIHGDTWMAKLTAYSAMEGEK